MAIVSATATRRAVFAMMPHRPRGSRRLGHDTEDTCRRVTPCLDADRAWHSTVRAPGGPRALSVTTRRGASS